jgi:polysaccharide export outer membrane protein
MVMLAALLTTGCSMTDYTLFQDDDLPDDPTVVSDKKYKDEMVFENKISPNDRVEIMVYTKASEGQELVSMVTDPRRLEVVAGETPGFLITQKGTIRLPLVGSVKISGMTEDGAQSYLIKEYKKYVRNPYVTVKITNQRIYVLGEVNTPGVVPVTNGTMNLVEAIARSGDMTDYADRLAIKVLRGDLRDPEVKVIDLTQMSSIRLASLYLKPNDIVYVQPRAMKGYNMAFDQIAPPFELISTMLLPFVHIAYLSGL